MSEETLPTEREVSGEFVSAVAFAAEKHRTQPRKGTEIPYLSHLLATAAVTMECGGTETQRIAAILHDVLEDTDTSVEELQSQFGAEVTGIVLACSDYLSFRDGPTKPDWGVRKLRYLEALRSHTGDALLVAVADKIHNGESLLNEIRTSTGSAWERFNAPRWDVEWYYESVLRIATEHLHNPAAVRRLRALVSALQRSDVYLEQEREAISNSYDVIDSADWADHPWLSRMLAGSDFDGDSARFWVTSDEAVGDSLRRIIFHYRSDTMEWEKAPTCEGAFFPGHGNARAAAGFYTPFDYHPFMELSGTVPEHRVNLRYRALVPKSWQSPRTVDTVPAS